MAKKNDKNRKRRYTEWLKEIERKNNIKKELKVVEKSRKTDNSSEDVGKNRDVVMEIIKVKKNVKLDKKARKRLSKLSNIKKNNISIKL